MLSFKRLVPGGAKRSCRSASIGLPRALFYYLHPGLWESFFRALGHTAIVSGPTTRETVERAELISETEHCLPVKLLDAHLDELSGRADLLFVPRILSLRQGCIACPKLAALPDAVRAQFGSRIGGILTVDVNENVSPLPVTLAELGGKLGADPDLIRRAVQVARQALPDRSRAGVTENQKGARGKPYYLVIGHPYNLDDRHLAKPVFDTLAALDARAEQVATQGIQEPRGPLKWDTCAGLYEALRTLDAATCRGVIQLTSFNCGCDSMAAVFYRDILRDKHIPYLALTLDGHTARAGLETRLEAFVDSIRERS